MGRIDDAIKRLKQATSELGEAETGEYPVLDAPPAGAPVAPREKPPREEPPAAAAAAPAGPALAGGGRKIHLHRKHLAELGLLDPNQRRKRLTYEYRQIMMRLIELAKGPPKPDAPPCNLVMISSAAPGEGRSFVALNLALSLASEVENDAVLIDADAVGNGLTKAFAAVSERGLSDLLADTELGAEKHVMPTDEGGFSFLPIGHRPNKIGELLETADGLGALTRLARQHPACLFLIDTPAIEVSDVGTRLARFVGQTVFVVEAGVSPQQQVREAVAALDVGASLSVVLNKSAQRADQL